MVLHVLGVVGLVHRVVRTEIAGEDPCCPWMLVLHVGLQGSGLYAGVLAECTLVRPVTSVSHAVSSEGVVVARLVLTQITPA